MKPIDQPPPSTAESDSVITDPNARNTSDVFSGKLEPDPVGTPPLAESKAKGKTLSAFEALMQMGKNVEYARVRVKMMSTRYKYAQKQE